MEVILINISDLSRISSHSNCCWVRKAKGIAQGWAMHRWFQSPGDLSHSSLRRNQIFSQKEEHLFEAQGLEKALGCLGRWHPPIHQRGLAAWTSSEDNTCQWVTLSTIPVLLMPASGKWQLQPLNTKSVHNYRGVNSAASSHIVMAFPNWGMCSAKSHCSQWHLHWSLFRKKGASLSIFCSVQYHLFPTLLQERPSGTCLTLPRVGSDQPKADKAHGGGLCLCL